MAEHEPAKYPWGDSRRFNSSALYFRKRFGTRVQKLSVNAGFSCPNRDGTKGTGGCTYCNNSAFNPSYCKPEKPVATQLEEGIAFHRRRYRRASAYLAYFQAFSNTHAPLAALKRIYAEALAFPEVAGIVIGTRPDCIDDEKLDYLGELSYKHYVAVEYGIESCSDKTLERINRRHTFAEAAEAVRKTAMRGISTGAHFIFGLPGETRNGMMTHAHIISQLPLATVKFHQLQIIKGTAMEREYLGNPLDFVTFTCDRYAGFIIEFLEKLNPEIAVERLTGEVPPRFLSAEPWSGMRADQIAAMIENRMEQLDTWQGRLFSK
ncbi:MAG: TIGR01212 family radical SAM protein [Bacteroidales bacterium]|jgi:radical SAM protein (TIGR01212 family)|nr:TIGR01212 family radical SAM protein [Bacteroidales bacterium]